jgi:hypothetical protein
MDTFALTSDESDKILSALSSNDAESVSVILEFMNTHYSSHFSQGVLTLRNNPTSSKEPLTLKIFVDRQLGEQREQQVKRLISAIVDEVYFTQECLESGLSGEIDRNRSMGSLHISVVKANYNQTHSILNNPTENFMSRNIQEKATFDFIKAQLSTTSSPEDLESAKENADPIFRMVKNQLEFSEKLSKIININEKDRLDFGSLQDLEKNELLTLIDHHRICLMTPKPF